MSGSPAAVQTSRFAEVTFREETGHSHSSQDVWALLHSQDDVSQELEKRAVFFFPDHEPIATNKFRYKLIAKR